VRRVGPARLTRRCRASLGICERPGRRRKPVKTFLPFNTRFTHKVAFADRDALPSEDVVCGCGVEVKVGLGEGQQNILCGVIEMAVAEGEAHIAAKQSIDLGGFACFKSGDGL
jgi:hypothetical protein